MNSFTLRKTDFDKKTLVSYGNMFLIGNGHLGYRGTLEEYRKSELVGLNIVGFYDQYLDKWRESINTPNPFYFDIKNHNCLYNKPNSHQINLDIKHEVFSRISEFNDLTISSKRTIHQEIDNLLLCEYCIDIKNETNLEMIFGLDLDMYEINGPHFKYKEILRNKNLICFHGITNEDKNLYMDVYYKTNNDPIIEFKNNYFSINKKISSNKKIVIQVYAKIYENNFSLQERKKFLALVKNYNFDELFVSSTKAFEKKWDIADIEIKGNEEAQFNMRYSIYHLLILGNENYSHSIPARGVSGSTYKGAIFWDSEIFIFPFFLMTNLKIARNILQYRINTLQGAKAKAKEFGYDGAFYAWESQDSGLEACSKYNVSDPITNEPIRTYFNEKQIHISPDIVYAFDQYIIRSKDYKFLSDGGYEVIKEVAKFILSYVTLGDDGYYHINDVIGPDEYHERVNDNAFTNYMCEYSLKTYLKYYNFILDNQIMDVSDDFTLIEKVENILKKLYLPLTDENGILEQFDGYLKLENISVDGVRKRLKNPQEYWGSKNGVATPTRVIKQADVIALMTLLSDKFTLEDIKINYDFYNYYTEHGSSLSASMYSQCACKINYLDDAYSMFMKSASIDLGTNQKMFAGGIYIGGSHPASNGGSYLSLINGFCGMKFNNNQYEFTSHLPEQIEEVTFKYIEFNKIKKAIINKNFIKIMEVKDYD